MNRRKLYIVAAMSEAHISHVPHIELKTCMSCKWFRPARSQVFGKCVSEYESGYREFDDIPLDIGQLCNSDFSCLDHSGLNTFLKDYGEV